MKVTYDQEADALYIQFLEGVVTTAHVAEGIAVDFGVDDRIAGIEILDARQRVGDPETFRRVAFEDITEAKPASVAELQAR